MLLFAGMSQAPLGDVARVKECKVPLPDQEKLLADVAPTQEPPSPLGVVISEPGEGNVGRAMQDQHGGESDKPQKCGAQVKVGVKEMDPNSSTHVLPEPPWIQKVGVNQGEQEKEKEEEEKENKSQKISVEDEGTEAESEPAELVLSIPFSQVKLITKRGRGISPCKNMSWFCVYVPF